MKGADNAVLSGTVTASDEEREDEVPAPRAQRGLLSLRSSPLTRKMILFNLVALNVLVAGVFHLNSTRDDLVMQHLSGLVGEVELVANVFELQLQRRTTTGLTENSEIDVVAILAQLDLQKGTETYVFDETGALAGQAAGRAVRFGSDTYQKPPVVINMLARLWKWLSITSFRRADQGIHTLEGQARSQVRAALKHGTQVSTGKVDGSTVFTVTAPIMQDGAAIAVIAIFSATGEIDSLMMAEQERFLQMFLIATLVSVGLSLVLASSVAHPLADLAAATEIGSSRSRSGQEIKRIRIPDLTARSDEIGRLSGALRGMVAALYDRIDGNEQFAADVAHEIKNPLASLRSAVGTMRLTRREDQRAKLLDVIEHDVRRLDRLVSDISNASRLDSELIKEQEKPFDLLSMMRNLSQYLATQAGEKGIELITDFPERKIIISGLEARLAQVFVNLITNAISFCDEGDAIRIWVRCRENRVLIVVEDTGPGVPEEALTQVFHRFYSQRDASQFGNNSGLGLAISKQIVVAHGGVIWAENIRPTNADITSDPLGARFIVGLPI